MKCHLTVECHLADECHRTVETTSHWSVTSQRIVTLLWSVTSQRSVNNECVNPVSALNAADLSRGKIQESGRHLKLLNLSYQASNLLTELVWEMLWLVKLVPQKKKLA